MIDLVRLCRFAGADVILDKAVGLDPEAKTVTLASGRQAAFDIASIDIGITSDLPQVDGFIAHGVSAKPLGGYAARWEHFLSIPLTPQCAPPALSSSRRRAWVGVENWPLRKPKPDAKQNRAAAPTSTVVDPHAQPPLANMGPKSAHAGDEIRGACGAYGGCGPLHPERRARAGGSEGRCGPCWMMANAACNPIFTPVPWPGIAPPTARLVGAEPGLETCMSGFITVGRPLKNRPGGAISSRSASCGHSVPPIGGRRPKSGPSYAVP